MNLKKSTLIAIKGIGAAIIPGILVSIGTRIAMNIPAPVISFLLAGMLMISGLLMWGWLCNIFWKWT